jgi:hypothetical protein
MRTRIEAGTDIAMVGAWDVSRNEVPLARLWGKEFTQTLEQDALAGHLFLVHTSADGGGPIDVLVDEDIPVGFRSQVSERPGEYLLIVSSGRLMVGGVEDYRSGKPQITVARRVAMIPPGAYLLKCFVGEEETISSSPSQGELKHAVGADDFQYYSRMERWSHLGFLTLLLFPALWPMLGWKISAEITAVAVLAYFNVLERLFLKRNVRYQRIKQLVNDVYLKASANEAPTFIFQLRTISDVAGLKGGSLDMQPTSQGSALLCQAANI